MSNSEPSKNKTAADPSTGARLPRSGLREYKDVSKMEENTSEAYTPRGGDPLDPKISSKIPVAERDIWKERDKQFDELFKGALTTFYTNRAINIILVIVGLFLIAYALAYHWNFSMEVANTGEQENQFTNNTTGATGTSSGNKPTNIPDLTSIVTGSGGLGTLITVFFYKSQRYIQRALSNLATVDILYKSHYLAFESISDYNYIKLKYPKDERVRTLDDLEKVNNLLKDISTSYVSTLQEKSRMEDEK